MIVSSIPRIKMQMQWNSKFHLFRVKYIILWRRIFVRGGQIETHAASWSATRTDTRHGDMLLWSWDNARNHVQHGVVDPGTSFISPCSWRRFARKNILLKPIRPYARTQHRVRFRTKKLITFRIVLCTGVSLLDVTVNANDTVWQCRGVIISDSRDILILSRIRRSCTVRAHVGEGHDYYI